MSTNARFETIDAHHVRRDPDTPTDIRSHAQHTGTLSYQDGFTSSRAAWCVFLFVRVDSQAPKWILL